MTRPTRRLIDLFNLTRYPQETAVKRLTVPLPSLKSGAGTVNLTR